MAMQTKSGHVTLEPNGKINADNWDCPTKIDVGQIASYDTIIISHDAPPLNIFYQTKSGKKIKVFDMEDAQKYEAQECAEFLRSRGGDSGEI
jgi:hypothetical protein